MVLRTEFRPGRPVCALLLSFLPVLVLLRDRFSLCNFGCPKTPWPQIHREPFSSASWTLSLKRYAAMSSKTLFSRNQTEKTNSTFHFTFFCSWSFWTPGLNFSDSDWPKPYSCSCFCYCPHRPWCTCEEWAWKGTRVGLIRRWCDCRPGSKLGRSPDEEGELSNDHGQILMCKHQHCPVPGDSWAELPHLLLSNSASRWQTWLTP